MEVTLADLWLEASEEGDGSEVEPKEGLGEKCVNFCLVGCFLTTTTINFQSMRIVLANLWYPLDGVTITNIGEKCFCSGFILRLI